jgi:hypothetical protein
MASPLSPLTENALNTKLPSSRDQSFISTPETSKISHVQPASATYNDEITWDEGPSSPFVTEVASELERRTVSSEVFKAKLFEAIQETSEPNTPVQKAPFHIAEDETSTQPAGHEATENITQSTFIFAKGSPKKTSPIKTSPTKNPSTIRFQEETTATLVRHHSQDRFVAVEESEIEDMTSMTFNEDAGIDDTCFSTFSEIPNTDMTAFAKLGQRSPTKQMSFDQVFPK